MSVSDDADIVAGAISKAEMNYGSFKSQTPFESRRKAR